MTNKVCFAPKLVEQTEFNESEQGNVMSTTSAAGAKLMNKSILTYMNKTE